MRDIGNLKHAFGEAGEGFRAGVFRALAGLRTDEEKKPMKRSRLKLSLVIGLAIFLMTATAFALANPWGIMDFLTNRRSSVTVLPEAQEIVQKDVPQQGGKADCATFAVREAVFDGKDVFIAVEAKPAAEKYLLLGPDSYPQYPVSDLGPLFEGKTGNIADYARQNGKELIHTYASIDGNCSIDFVLEEDGTLVYLINGRYEAEGDVTLTVNCGVAPFITKDGKQIVDHENLQRTPLTVKLHNTGTKGAITSTASAEFAGCGVRVDRITLTGSEMGMYATIEYTVTDAETFAKTEDGLWFEFVDESGEPLPSGAGTVGTGIVTEDGGMRFVQDLTIQASEELPGQVRLRAFNCWTKERYETHVFDLN